MVITTKARILQILTGHEAARIRFTFPAGGVNHTITAHVFHRVARAIRHGHIHVTVTTTLPVGVGAQYHTDTDTIEAPRVIGRPDEGLILHECTHAFYDITSNPINALDDEASAYVVDALYYRMTGLTRPRWNNEPHATAGPVADALLQDYQRGAVAVPTVNAAAWANLRNAIRTNGTYTGEPPATGGSYIHDGVR